MHWAAWIGVCGGALCLVYALVTILVLGRAAMGRRCPVAKLAQCSKLVVLVREDDREITIEDPGLIAEIASFLSDERQPALEQVDTWVELCFMDGEKKYEIMASRFGWNWSYEKASSRDITDEAAFVELIEGRVVSSEG